MRLGDLDVLIEADRIRVRRRIKGPLGQKWTDLGVFFPRYYCPKCGAVIDK